MNSLSSIPYKTKQFFFVLIKLSIVFGSLYFIYNKLTNNDELDFTVFIELLNKTDGFTAKNILFLCLLSVLNWGFEILKWRNLVSFIKPITFIEATKQSLAALTASLFTPNRIGDYAAKTVYFSKRFHKKVLLLNLLSNMAQMATTSFVGIIGVMFFVTIYNPEISYYKIGKLLFIVISLIAFGWFIIANKQINIRGFSLKKITQFIKSIPLTTHINTLLFSVIRYLIFSFQFYFLLTIFGSHITYPDAMVIITSMYFLASIVPSIFIFDVVIKGSIAVYLFTFANVNSLVVLSIIMSMWLLNFVLPSLIGSYFVLNFKFPTNFDKPNNVGF